jgi:hypothetical protein
MQWKEHRERSDFKQFTKYLNLVLSRKNAKLMTKGRHMKLEERETCAERTSIKDDDQVEFIAEKKRKKNLQSKECTTKKINNSKQGKRENVLKNEVRVNGTMKNDKKEVKEMDWLKREEISLPNITRESHGSVVIKFNADENVKLDIYLPPLI